MTKYVVTLSVISDHNACGNDNRTDIKSFIYDDRKEAFDKYVALQQNVCLNGNIDFEHTYIIDKDNAIAVIDIIDDKQFMHRYRISINTIS